MNNKAKNYLDKIKLMLRVLTGIHLVIYILFIPFVIFGIAFKESIFDILFFSILPLIIIFIPFITSFFIEKRNKKIWIFLMILSILFLLNFPIGTIFGIIILNYINKPETKRYFRV